MKKLGAVIIIYFLSVTSINCQSYLFTGYSINDGLSQSVVNCLFQDSRGYIWIGTQNGLNRFDGENFTVFTTHPGDSSSISNNWIYAIAEDYAGNLWIGTKGGLNQYISADNKFRRIKWKSNYTHDVTKYCYDVFCLKNGNILINTPPVLTIYNPEKENFEQFQSNFEYDGAVKDVRIPVLQVSDEKILMGSTEGLAEFSLHSLKFNYYRFFSQSGQQEENAEATALYKDSKGNLWAGTTNGLYIYDSSLVCFEKIQLPQGHPDNTLLNESCIRTIIEEKNGNLLIGTEGAGLFVVKPLTDKIEIIQNFTAENSGISHNIIQSLLIDKSENLWTGTLSGISKTDLKPKTFNLFRKSNDPNSIDLLGNVIASLFKNDDGIVWIGNWGQGLNLLNRSTMEVEHFSTQHNDNHYLPNDFIHVIFKDTAKNIWLGTRNGILIYDTLQNRFIPYQVFYKNPALPSFTNIRIYMIIQDRSSNYWIGTQNGLYKISLINSTVDVYHTGLDELHRLSANLVYCLLEDSDGLIWIATVNGLDVFNPFTGRINHYTKKESGLIDDFVVSLCEDKYRKIWVGTSTYISVFDKRDSSFTWYTQESGLPNNNIFEIIKDKNNDLWIATGRGLCRYDDENNTFQTFTTEDGLQSLEFNLRAAWLCNDGEMLIGGMNGFNTFYPDSIYNNPYIPNLVFTSFYKTRGTKREYLIPDINKKIKLNYNVTSFTLEFTALEFTNPKENNFAYQMEGLSDEWTNIGNRKFVPFSGLQPGEYTFKVKGSNNDGVWNPEEISVGIIVVPPWWRSTIAYITYILLIALAIFTYIKLRIRKLQHDKKTLEQKVHERTLQVEQQNKLIISKNQELRELNLTKDKFFSIIGHDLGNQFNIILGYLEVLLSDFKKMKLSEAENHLNTVFISSKHAYGLLENLLTWARMQINSIEYNPQTFNLASKINETAELFEGASFNKNITIEVRAGKNLTAFADLNIFSTVLRNLIANAVKFTNETGRIVITAEGKDEYCIISVQDNGVGISEENLQKIFRIDSKHKTLGTNGEKGTGLGLVLCKEFIEKLDGKIWVESTEGKGSKFSFSLPLKSNAATISKVTKNVNI